MKILVACEFSGTVRRAFDAKGHDVISCDLLPADDGSLFHYRGPVEDMLEQHWDMMLAFPPCTHLAVSGAKFFAQKIKDGRQQQGIDFFMSMINADIDRIAVEKSYRHYVNQVQEARPDSAAIRIRRCVQEVNVSMAEEPAVATAN